MNTPEDSNETILGLNPADLLVRGLQSGKAATGSPQAWQPPTPEELAALLPQYEIEALLGRGGMGAVYQGRQAALDRAVAIKLLPAELAADTEFLTRFQREARTLAKLQHPGIVAVHDFGQTSEGHLFFVMEFVNGTDLARLIHGPGVNPAQALEIIAQVCEALQYAHSQGVIHRDIKPANVLVNQEGRAKLADFGLARPTSDETASLTRSNVVMGTPDNIAPEQMYGHADHRADLYSLGIMLYEMLTGQTPRGAWAPPSQRVQVDVRLDQVVIRALQQDPAMRYQQASEIKTDVDVIRTTPLPKVGKGKKPPAPGQRTTPLPKAKRPGNKFAIVAALVLLLAATGWWVIQPETKSAASNLPWQKAVWSDQDRARLSDDGWLTTGDELKTSIPERVPGEQLNFADGALRAQVRFEAKPKHRPAMSFWLRMPRERSIQFLITELEFKATLNGDKGAEMGRIAFDTPYQRGDVEHFEVAAVGDRFVAHFKGKQLSFQCPEANRNGSALFHGQSYAIKDVEYLHLDGHPDPLKALGWEAPATAAPAIPWTRIEHTAEEWAKTGQTLKDGWVHNPDKNILVFDRLSAAKATSQFVVRTKVKFHEVESNLNIVNQTGGGHTWRKIQFYSHKQTILNGDHPPATTQRHVTKVELDEEALVEMLVAGDKVYTRFNGQPVVVGDLSPIIPWVQCHLMGGLSYSLRDTEYAILDDIPDPLKVLGWEVPEATTEKPSTATPSDAVLKARERGGRLRVFGNSHQGPVELGKTVEFDDFRTVVVSPFGWSARRKGGDTYCVAGLETSHAGPAVELGPFLTSFLQRDKVPVMQMRTDGSYRNLFSNGGSQHRKEWADHRAVAFLNPGNYILSLDSGGKILRGEHWYGAKMTDRIPPPEDYFLGARAYTTVRDHYISARPGLPVRSFSAKTGQIIDFSPSIQEIVEMDATADEQVIMRDASGQVFVVTPDGKPHGTVPSDIGPAVAVRAGANMFAAQRTDGTWRAWGESDGLVAQTDRVGHAVDIDFHSENRGKISYMVWIEPVDGSTAASSPKDEGWRDFLAELAEGPRKNEQLGIFWKRESSGWWVAKYFTFMIPDETGCDLAIRATGTSSRLSVFARSDYSGSLYASAGFAKIQRSDEVLKQFKLGQDFDASKGHTVELRAIGNTLTLLIDDKELGSVEDDTHPVGGQFGVTAGEGSLVEKVEYRFLNEPAKTGATARDPQSTAEAKKRLVEARAHLKAGDLAETRKLAESALTTAPGDLTTQAEVALILAESQAPERAAALAQEFVTQAEAEHSQFAAITELRVKLTPTLKQYDQHLRTAAELVSKGDDAGEIRELKAALTLVPDGKLAAEKLTANPLHVGRALPGRKFSNELGHTFVPVAGLPNVLFSIWETRVKDFEQFVKETGYDMSGLEPYGSDKKGTWQKPGFEQTGDHPVVLISRHDAVAFCRWLTEKERKAGRLLPGQVYRLPTDREWSAAMGVLDEPGDFPEERKFPENVFTWPKGSAPPRNAENLNWTNDDFRFTAPVGSGVANSFGIYDLLGNVAEICADPWGIADPNGHDAAATIRGSAYQSELKVWRYRQDDTLAGAVRIGSANLGYRCVLDLKTEEQRATQTMMEEAVASLRALDAAQNRPVREITMVVNNEMVLMDLRRWRHLNEEESRRLAGLPLTRLMFSTSERKGRLEVLKTFPLQVLYIALEVAGDHSRYLLDNVKGLPLTHANITQHPDMGMALKSLDFLVGAPLRQLYLVGFKNLESIEPLRGMPLEALSFYGTTARLDLSPAKDAPLRRLSLPRSVSLEQFIETCDWWGAKLVQVESDGAAILSRFFREAALTGQPAKVQEVKEALSKKLAGFPIFKGWLDTLNSATKTNIDSSMIVARFIGGDATAFNGQFQAFKDHAYLFWPEVSSLVEAKELAAKLGGHLVTITSKEENDFIIQQMEAGVFRKDCALGLERTGSGRMAWKWVTGEPLEYHNWGPESGFGGTNAVFVQEKGQWLWFHGSDGFHPFIIEWDMPTPQPPVKK